MVSQTSAFARLRGLLHGVPVHQGLDPLPLHLGESRLTTPVVDHTPLADVAEWTRYPALGGTPELRAAYTEWLGRRFGVAGAVRDGRVAVEPTPGAKQAIATVIALAVGRARGATTPAVVLPNPFYPTYLAGTEAAGARPVFYDTRDDTAAAVAAAVRDAPGPVAAVVVCNPGNPRGEVLDAGTLRAIARTAADSTLLVDECYGELTVDRVPTGYLPLVADGAVPGPSVVSHTLSKRSGMPGLRSGFLAGDPTTIAAYADHNRACGVSTPAPVCAVAAALWADDAHVAAAQAALIANWDLADQALAAVPGYRRAEAGFFLWLPVHDDEEVAVRLWRDHAVSVMPGRYLSAGDERGHDPGAGHVRIALVHAPAPMREALTRLREALTYDEELIR